VKPLVVFPDAERAAIDYLEDALAARGESYKPTAVTASFPTSSPAAGTTVLQVELDGTPTVEYPATERATVRFTAWAAKGQGSKAKQAAALVQGLVATHPGDGDVFATRILTGRLEGSDPDTGYTFASFTARFSLRPSAL